MTKRCTCARALRRAGGMALLALLAGCMALPLPETMPPHAPPSPAPTVSAVAPSPSPSSAPTPDVTLRAAEVPPAPSSSPTPTEEAPDELILSAVGDCTLGGDAGRGQLDAFRAVFAQNAPEYFFQHALPFTGADDLTLANLEGPLTAIDAAADKEFAFRGDAEFAAILARGGVEAVTLSNNHIYDYGEDGYADTLEALAAHGIAAADIGSPVAYPVGERLIGVVASKFPSGGRVEQMKKDIAALREQGCAVVAAMVHWGEERAEAPTPELQSIARELINAGADWVVGHHPHILQGIERYRGRVIAYSLGNFVFGGNRNPEERETAILQLRVRFDGEEPAFAFRVLPFAVSGARGNDYRPVPLEDEAAQAVFDLINRRGAELPGGVEVNWDWQDVLP